MRPLRYDDAFKNILNEKIHEKFLFLFNVKVQSTGFCQKLNLQRSLLISSLFDIIFGIIIVILFFNTIETSQENFLYFIETFVLITGICFGFVGFDSATNLRKGNMAIYKNWRIFISFFFLFSELINSFAVFCKFTSSGGGHNCGNFGNAFLVIIFFAMNLYFTKIAWSFFIRLDKGHEILIIHGKHLEKIMNDETYKITDIKKYVPPEQSMSSKTTTPQNDTELTLKTPK
jgi:hypothetical protein